MRAAQQTLSGSPCSPATLADARGSRVCREVRQQVTVGCSVTFAGVPGLSRRGDISLVATGYSSLRQPAGPANNRASVSARTPAGASSGTPSCCQILYQDEHIIAVDKPARLPVLASGRGRKRPRAADTLLERLASQLGVSAQPNESADGVGLHSVHRLDQDTSGVVLFALDRAPRHCCCSLCLGCCHRPDQSAGGLWPAQRRARRRFALSGAPPPHDT